MAATDVLAQFKGFFEKLNKLQKTIIGGITILIIGGIIALIAYNSSDKDMSILWDNLEPMDAANITDYLKTNKIDYKLINNGSAIVVDKESVNETRLALSKQGLPAESYVGYELFDKTNLGMSEFVQKLNYRRALEGELQRTIKSMDEIKDVKVHIVIPEKSLFKKDEKQPTAAIKLHFKSGKSLNKISVEGIQNLVSSSVEGMSPDKVTVTDNQGRILSENNMEENPLAKLSATQYQLKEKIEEGLSNKVQALLAPAVGIDNVRVKPNVEMEFDQLQVDKTDYDPERQVERSEQNISDIATDVDTSSFVPGINARQEKLNEIKNYEITKTDSHYVRSPGNIKRLTVTAVLNEVVEVKKTPKGMDTVVMRQRTPEELENFKEAIKNAVGFDERRGDEVNVLCVPFTEQISERVFEVQEHNRLVSIPWYDKEDNKKLLLLLGAVLLTIIMMYRLLHAKFVKDKMRIAMGLPNKLEQPKLDKFDNALIAVPEEEFELEEEFEEDDEAFQDFQEEIAETSMLEELIDDTDDEIDDIDIDDIDLITMSDELPEQLLLDGQLVDDMDFFDTEYVEDSMSGRVAANDDNPLLERAKNALSNVQTMEEISEDDMIKMELKEKVHQFIVGQPDVAVKIFRIFISQDGDET